MGDIKLMFCVNMCIVSAGNYRTLSEVVKLAVCHFSWWPVFWGCQTSFTMPDPRSVTV